MSLILLNLQSNQKINLDDNTPLIIGRGNVEGCFDKRVSRNHGRITCTVDGKIRLVALHSNPCFFTRNGVPPVLQLNKDEEETLSEGDYLGLLPNAFWFKITSDEKNGIKNEPKCSSERTNITSDEINQTIVISENCIATSHSDEITICEKPECSFSDRTKKDNLNSLQPSASNNESNSLNSSKVYGTPEFEKTKRLPLWMYEIDDPVGSNTSTNKHFLKSDRESKGKKQKTLPEIEIKKEPEIKLEDEVKIEYDIKNLNFPSTSKVENVETSNVACKSEAQEEAGKDRNENDGCESSFDSKTDFSSKRPICQYEDNCYRKNPQHKLEFSHPGDSDYVPYEERPLCQYGARCYRKNEKHKTEFRHPSADSSSQNLSSPSCSPDSRASSPLPAKRRRKKVKTQSFDYEDDDECDLEDPFTNDASSDEYVPSSLESEEEDDLDASREDD